MCSPPVYSKTPWIYLWGELSKCTVCVHTGDFRGLRTRPQHSWRVQTPVQHKFSVLCSQKTSCSCEPSKLSEWAWWPLTPRSHILEVHVWLAAGFPYNFSQQSHRQIATKKRLLRIGATSAEFQDISPRLSSWQIPSVSRDCSGAPSFLSQ